MKIAVKFQSQNEMNKGLIPEYWPWKRVDIEDSEQLNYEAQSWTVFTQTEFDEYIRVNGVKIETHFMNQISDQYKYLDISIQKKIDFAQDLIDRLKKKNILEGINAAQGMWMHQKVRALPVSFAGMTFTIDLMNLVISGDLELACLSLIYSPADDMSETYHWLSSDRKAWIINELKLFLGWP